MRAESNAWAAQTGKAPSPSLERKNLSLFQVRKKSKNYLKIEHRIGILVLFTTCNIFKLLTSEMVLSFSSLILLQSFPARWRFHRSGHDRDTRHRSGFLGSGQEIGAAEAFPRDPLDDVILQVCDPTR